MYTWQSSSGRANIISTLVPSLVPSVARPGVLTGVECSSASCIGASPEAYGLWVSGWSIRSQASWNQGLLRSGCPEWGGGKNRDISHRCHQSRCFLLLQWRLKRLQARTRRIKCQTGQGHGFAGRGLAEEATFQLVTHSFSHLLHKHVFIRFLQWGVYHHIKAKTKISGISFDLHIGSAKSSYMTFNELYTFSLPQFPIIKTVIVTQRVVSTKRVMHLKFAGQCLAYNKAS